MQSAGIDLFGIIAAACGYLGIEEKKLARQKRHVEIARARALISYVATQILSITESEVARRFNGDRSAISRATLKESREPGISCSHQNDTKKTRNKSTLNVSFVSQKANANIKQC